MGFFQLGGFLDSQGEKGSPFSSEWKRIGRLGQAGYDYGTGLTDEGLGGLRDLRRTYADRTKDPLGELGRGIFARARGAASDAFVRNVNAGDARRRQLAAQTGGALTPEQIAALNAEDRRAAGEGLFGAQRDISTSEAEMSLSEAQKFFDRMEGIDRTITGVGQNEKARGLSAILDAIGGRQARMKAIMSSIFGGIGAASGFGGGSTISAGNPIT